MKRRSFMKSMAGAAVAATVAPAGLAQSPAAVVAPAAPAKAARLVIHKVVLCHHRDDFVCDPDLLMRSFISPPETSP